MVAVFSMSSIGIVFPSLFSSSIIISFIITSLLLWLAGVSVAILSMSIVPVFSSNATCLRQWSISSTALFASSFVTCSLKCSLADASDSLTSASSCLALIGIAFITSPVALPLIFRKYFFSSSIASLVSFGVLVCFAYAMYFFSIWVSTGGFDMLSLCISSMNVAICSSFFCSGRSFIGNIRSNRFMNVDGRSIWLAIVS